MSSSCPRNPLGQPACHVVDHPDYPNLESYCTECNKRFPKDGGLFQSFIFFLSLVIALFVMLAMQSEVDSIDPGVPQSPGKSLSYPACDRLYGDQCG
ncbi:MAG: hypothetical protein HC881_07000 [Leptolyngbyaceae cyanobacterium SL_7_1]|nr:hypothetical protein [Leptolyngbyaceae cyanobacterium SL_7_1]